MGKITLWQSFDSHPVSELVDPVSWLWLWEDFLQHDQLLHMFHWIHTDQKNCRKKQMQICVIWLNISPIIHSHTSFRYVALATTVWWCMYVATSQMQIPRSYEFYWAMNCTHWYLFTVGSYLSKHAGTNRQLNNTICIESRMLSI